MYKYSRKKILHRLTENSVGRADLMRKTGKQIVEIPYNDYHFVVLNLLAQKEDRKECLNEMEGRVVTIIKKWLKENQTCPDCLGKNGCMCALKSTPSPLEIEEIKRFVIIGKTNNDTEILYPTSKDMAIKLNKLISNQKKLYQYIKEKKI